MTDKRTALVAGATGLVGSLLLGQLLANEAYAHIDVISRRALDLRHPKLRVYVADFGKLDAYRKVFQTDDLFCCLGTTMKKAGSKEAFRRVDYEYPLELARLAKAEGARRFLLVSALGADPASRIYYNRVKGEVERDIRKIGLPSLHIFRPSLLIGERKERRSGEQTAIWASRLLDPVMIGPLSAYRGIAASQVAHAMVKTALSNDRLGTFLYRSADMQRM